MELWFQQDGATCHTARATIDLLKDTFGDRLISRFEPVNWPPISCDLTPLYFLWGYVKSLVYADKPQTLDHLEDNIRRVIADIRPQMLEKVIENWTSRLDYIRASRGSPMPEIIFKILKKIINENNLLNPNQYGFTNKLSTLHPLLRLTEHISEGFQKKKSTEAVFLDIQKAFDRVWINGLTFKLISYNLPAPMIHLIHSYLTNRSFRIKINETLSHEYSVSAGCPQGSLLSPLLFNLYINDIPDYSLTKINLYANDTAIHATYKKLSTISYAINKHLLHLQNFYDKWKISINVEKSTAIIFTKKLSFPPPIIMYNKQIPWSQEAKYLGIIFDTNLTWK
ncbi:probable RNA-directed DNA polymerase from transposon X-element [Trichonephila clavipes]|nr:probable RNA-directed DNA polymerase from transposon X-element [Trichonephila clavipes]